MGWALKKRSENGGYFLPDALGREAFFPPQACEAGGPRARSRWASEGAPPAKGANPKQAELRGNSKGLLMTFFFNVT